MLLSEFITFSYGFFVLALGHSFFSDSCICFGFSVVPLGILFWTAYRYSFWFINSSSVLIPKSLFLFVLNMQNLVFKMFLKDSCARCMSVILCFEEVLVVLCIVPSWVNTSTFILRCFDLYITYSKKLQEYVSFFWWEFHSVNIKNCQNGH